MRATSWVFAILLSGATIAPADITGTFSLVPSEGGFTPPAGFVTSDLLVNATTDWLGANLILELTDGSIYQDALISGIGPPSSVLIGVIPSVRFDTYVTGALGIDGGSPSSAGGAVDLGGDASPKFDSEGINLNWFTTSVVDTGAFSLGRFTLSSDAVGTFSLRLDSLRQSSPYLLSGTIENGQFTAVPETGSFVLMATTFGAMLALRHLRRR